MFGLIFFIDFWDTCIIQQFATQSKYPFLEEKSGWDGLIFPQPKCATIFCIVAYDRIYDRAPSSDVIKFSWLRVPFCSSSLALHLICHALLRIYLPGHSTKNHRSLGHWGVVAFVSLLLKGPSFPPCMHLPKPVPEPSSHHPHPGRVWHSSHVFIPEQRSALRAHKNGQGDVN